MRRRRARLPPRSSSLNSLQNHDGLRNPGLALRAENRDASANVAEYALSPSDVSSLGPQRLWLTVQCCLMEDVARSRTEGAQTRDERRTAEEQSGGAERDRTVDLLTASPCR